MFPGSPLAPILAVPAGVPTPPAPGVATLAASVGLVAVLLLRRRPPVTWRTVYALVPWIVVGSVLRVLQDLGLYPPSFALRFDVAGAYLTALLFPGLAWVVLAEFSTERSSRSTATYLGAIGLGTITVLVPTAILGAGTGGLAGLVWLFVLPVAAAGLAFATILLLGLWHPDAAAYAGFVGGLVVFGHALDGLASVVAVAGLGTTPHTRLTQTVADLVVDLELASVVGVGPDAVWPIAFVWLRVALAVVAIALYAPYVREHPNRGNVVLGLVAAIGLAPGVRRLVMIAVGG